VKRSSSPRRSRSRRSGPIPSEKRMVAGRPKAGAAEHDKRGGRQTKTAAALPTRSAAESSAWELPRPLCQEGCRRPMPARTRRSRGPRSPQQHPRCESRDSVGLKTRICVLLRLSGNRVPGQLVTGGVDFRACAWNRHRRTAVARVRRTTGSGPKWLLAGARSGRAAGALGRRGRHACYARRVRAPGGRASWRLDLVRSECERGLCSDARSAGVSDCRVRSFRAVAFVRLWLIATRVFGGWRVVAAVSAARCG
jgi:hypothetical protein